ncbi:hypothetical protein E2542_SST24403 [Spatholobus suberectus]|nr:hypothetical protein E2542_SST24403 [Spatholobus suberectus]
MARMHILPRWFLTAEMPSTAGPPLPLARAQPRQARVMAPAPTDIVARIQLCLLFS